MKTPFRCAILSPFFYIVTGFFLGLAPQNSQTLPEIAQNSGVAPPNQTKER